MLDLGEYRGSVNIIAIMASRRLPQDEPIKELEAALQRQGFQTIWPQNSADLLQFIEHNPRICGVIFDWDEYSVDLCSDREYALGLSEDRHPHWAVHPRVRKYHSAVYPRAVQLCPGGKYTFCTPGHGGSAYQKTRWAACSMIFGGNTLKADVSISVTELGSCWIIPARTGGGVYRARLWRRNYMVTNGTSTSNKIVGMYSAPAGSTLLIDRNCHKSLAHLLMMSDGSCG